MFEPALRSQRGSLGRDRAPVSPERSECVREMPNPSRDLGRHLGDRSIGCGVPKPCSHRGITPICRPTGLLTPHTDNAEKPRG